MPRMPNIELLPKQTKDIIVEALENSVAVLNDPERWCKAATARDRRNVPICPSNNRAKKWCMTGILYPVIRRIFPERIEDRAYHIWACILFLNKSTGELASVFNDKSEHVDVVQAYHKAIGIVKGL